MMRLWEQFIFLDTSLPKGIFVNRAPRGSKYLFRRRSSFFVLLTPNSGVSFLRETSTDNEEAPSSRRSLRKSMEVAGRIARYAVILGPDELAYRQVHIKNLPTGDEQLVDQSTLLAKPQSFITNLVP